MAPRELGAKLLGQTPATDPKSLIGRTMEVGVPEITGDNSKYYLKLNVRITKIEGKTCLTSFNGMECTRDHLLRMVRKRNQKVESVVDVITQDGWVLRVKPWTVLNGKPVATVETKMRKMVYDFFNDYASKNNMSEMVRKILTTEMQMMVKKAGSKLYPVRFSEIARIKVLKSPEFLVAKPKEEEGKEETAERREEKPVKEKKAAKKKESKKKPEAQ